MRFQRAGLSTGKLGFGMRFLIKLLISVCIIVLCAQIGRNWCVYSSVAFE